MDFQTIVDSFSAMTCIISVEKKKDGSYGKIRIVTGNKPYIKSIEGSPDTPQMLTNKFVPNCEYETYLPKDLNFEDFCYRSAVLKQPLHSYVHPNIRTAMKTADQCMYKDKELYYKKHPKYSNR